MKRRIVLAVAVLLVSALGAGCFGPEDDPSTEVGGEETTPGETVEAGATPQGEPVNNTAIEEGETTAPGEETANGGEEETDDE